MLKMTLALAVTTAIIGGTAAISPMYTPVTSTVTSSMPSVQPDLPSDSMRKERLAVLTAVLQSGLTPAAIVHLDLSDAQIHAALNAAASEAASLGGLATMEEQLQQAILTTNAVGLEPLIPDPGTIPATELEQHAVLAAATEEVGNAALAALPVFDAEAIADNEAAVTAALRAIRRANRLGQPIAPAYLEILRQAGMSTEAERAAVETAQARAWEIMHAWASEE